jgi:hypothetical protein
MPDKTIIKQDEIEVKELKVDIIESDNTTDPIEISGDVTIGTVQRVN